MFFGLQRLQKGKLCADAGVLDEWLLRRCLQFYGTVAQILIRIVESSPNRWTSSFNSPSVAQTFSVSGMR